jgi:hypothetical protein
MDNQQRRDKGNEEGSEKNLRALRFFVVDFHISGRRPLRSE